MAANRTASVAVGQETPKGAKGGKGMKELIVGRPRNMMNRGTALRRALLQVTNAFSPNIYLVLSLNL